jgi:two-component system CheB/CheR fusion protein
MFDGIVSTHADITEKKKSEQMLADSYEELKNASRLLSDTNVQLERSNMDLMQFASVASHDLKEPLRKIQAFGNLLEAKLESTLGESELGYLQKMVSASGRMQTLIEDVLTLSKLSNNHLPRTKVKLGSVIRHITDDLEIVVKEKNAEIKVDALPEIYAVPGQVHQLFQNLISNALKFNDKEFPVIRVYASEISGALRAELQADENKNYTCITVEDNGIGFENEYRETIFGLFQRLNGRMYDGTGIGLAIAKKIVENHSGFLKAESVLGEGTKFHVIFPYK